MNEDTYSSSTTPVEASQMDATSDTVYNDLNLPHTSEQLDLAPDEPFTPAMIECLPQMSIEQLSKLESQLSKEFTNLSRDYINARKCRVLSLIKNVDRQIKIFQDNDADWTDDYFGQLKALEDFISHPESAMQLSEEFKLFLKSVKLPWELDDIFSSRKETLPFAEYFQRIILPHQKELVALDNLKNYLTSLVDELAEKNKVILWKQCRADVVEYKEKLIRETYEDLELLHKEFYGVNSNEALILRNNAYYRSTVPLLIPDHDEITQARLSTSNIDSFYDIGNPYCKKNKVEITSTKHDALDRLKRFENDQSQYSIPQIQGASVKLAGCMGLNMHDIDEDLALIRGLKGVDSSTAPVTTNKKAFSTRRWPESTANKNFTGINSNLAQNSMLKSTINENSSNMVPNDTSIGNASTSHLLYSELINLNRKGSEIELFPLNKGEEITEMETPGKHVDQENN